MGSLGRLIGASLGKAVFLRIILIKTALEPPRRRPIGGGDVHRIRGQGVSAPIFIILSIHAIPTQNSKEPIFFRETPNVFRSPYFF